MVTMTMDYFLGRALRVHAARTALVAGNRTATFAELDRQSTRLANSLLHAGIARGDRVAVLLANSIEFVEAELAIVKTGMVKVPVNDRLALPEIVHCLRDCGARAVITDPDHEAMISSTRAELPDVALLVSTQPGGAGTVLYGDLVAKGSDTPVAASRAPDDLYLLRYTGGTTGRPKGIMHTHASAVAIALSVIREHAITIDERYLQVGHLSHGANFTWPAFFGQGARIVLVPRFDALSVLELIQTHAITRVNMVPTMLNAVLQHPRFSEFDLSSVLTFTYASAPMPVEQLRVALDVLGPRLQQVYTLSESAVVSTLLRKEDHVVDGPPEVTARLASCGREALDVQLRIVDDEGRDRPPGEVGEIVLKSPGNMAGYWKQPALTAEVLRDGWVHTGDLAWRDAAGYVYLVDRKNDMIVTGAFNVYPREVEDVLYRHPAVREAAVVGIPHEKWGEAVVAFVALDREGHCTADELIELCRKNLASYKKPVEVHVLPELPKTSIGKISRRALRDPYWKGRPRQVA